MIITERAINIHCMLANHPGGELSRWQHVFVA